ncbi:MAG: TIGR02594 family protein [Pseudolabrys sp.]
MRKKILALTALSLTALLALSVPADSRPLKRGAETQQRAVAGRAAKANAQARQSRRHVSRNARAAHRAGRPMANIVRVQDDGDAGVPHTTISAARHRPMLGWPALVTEARKYLGTNPTNRSRLWCATFMNMVLHRVGYPGTGSDAARSFASYGRRINEPRVGAIAVLTRGKRGGHVGVVTGLDPRGNPIIISGNHGRKVGVGIYPKRRVIAYVMPVGAPQTTRYALASQASAPARASDASTGNRSNDEGGIASPITELLAAIESESRSTEQRPALQSRPPVREARPEPRRQAEPPPRPQRIVQQIDDEPVRVNYVRPVTAPQQPRAAASRRDLPLDPALARMLGIKQR